MENQIKVCISGEAFDNCNITVNIEKRSETKSSVETEQYETKMKLMEMRMKQMASMIETYDTMIQQLQSENTQLIECVIKSNVRPIIVTKDKVKDKVEVNVEKKEESLNDLMAEFTGNAIFSDSYDENEADDDLEEAFSVFD